MRKTEKFNMYVNCLVKTIHEPKDVCIRSVQSIYDRWDTLIKTGQVDKLCLNDINILLRHTVINIYKPDRSIKPIECLLDEMADQWLDMKMVDHMILGIIFSGTNEGDSFRFQMLMRNYKKFYGGNKK